jgi:two-component system NtrC family sensor kinase
MYGHSKQVIRVINSNDDTNFLLERVLKTTGYIVEVNRSWIEGWENLERHKPDLIIISNELGDEDFFVRVPKLVFAYPEIPVVLSLYQPSEEVLRRVVKLGAMDCLFMPLKAEDVRKTIENSIARAKKYQQTLLGKEIVDSSQLKQSVNDAQSLIRLGSEIINSLHFEQVLMRIIDAAIQITGAEEGSIMLVDHQSGELFMRAARNFHEDFVRTFRLPVQDSLVGSVVKTGQPVLLDEDTPQKIKTSYLVHSLIYIPLRFQGQVFGVLAVDNRKAGKAFTNEHVKLLEDLADFAVIALENARLYQERMNDISKYQKIFSEMREGIVIFDRDMRILTANSLVRQIFNLDSQKFTGVQFDEIFDHQDLIQFIDAFTQRKGANKMELPFADQYFEVLIKKISDIGYILSIHDISYYKKIAKIKTEFVNTVSHDLRSPLTAIMGYVDLIERAGDTNVMQRNFIKQVQDSVTDITNLVDDLLSLERIESGFDMTKEIVSLNDLLAKTAVSFIETAGSLGLDFELEICEETVPVYANPVQLKNMLEELAHNAFQFCEPGDKVLMRMQKKDSQIMLQIQDTGIGIPAKDLPHVFERFYRGSNVSEYLSGTGLGLSKVYTIVDQHLGRIWVDSKEGAGTTFSILLPISR